MFGFGGRQVLGFNFLRSLARRASTKRLTPKVPEGQAIYAIGDIHGRSDLLDQMLTLIEADNRKSASTAATTVFLGDYIDRGRDTRGVLNRLVSGSLPTPTVFLRGNHEAMLLDLRMRPELAAAWAENGGWETMQSYGLDVRKIKADGRLPEAVDELRNAMDSSHLAFLARTQVSCSYGDYLFCHAGVRPGVDLETQKVEDLLWIREPFLSSEADFGLVVIHGHTPVMQPEVRRNRINIDTGAYITGNLTCLCLETDQRRFLTAGRTR